MARDITPQEPPAVGETPPETTARLDRQLRALRLGPAPLPLTIPWEPSDSQ